MGQNLKTEANGMKLRLVKIFFPWQDNISGYKSRNICISTKFIPWVKQMNASVLNSSFCVKNES